MVVIIARNLATGIRNFNVVKEDLQGEGPITVEHVQNNQDVRDLLIRRGIVPENLPAEEDLKKLERKVKNLFPMECQKNKIRCGFPPIKREP